ncbi:MAG: GAF domain-containing protein, partial [Nocardioidaceae bacterium]
MTAITASFRRRLLGRSATPGAANGPVEPVAEPSGEAVPVDITPNDPLLAYLQSANGVVDIDTLKLDSPGLAAMKAAGVKLAVPLVSQGELIGVLSLGPRRSAQDYSTDDRKLLDALAA